MKKIIIFLIITMPLHVNAVFAISPMIEKHIFAAEKFSGKINKLPDDMIKKRLVFTGVIISGKGRYALIKEKSHKKHPETGKKAYKKGDEIAGAVISEIEPNYIILLNQGKRVKLALYTGDKLRPAAPVISSNKGNKPNSVHKNTVNSKKGSGKRISGRTAAKRTKKPKESRNPSLTLDAKILKHRPAKVNNNILGKPGNPFAKALKQAMEKRKIQGQPAANTTNPFLEAIKRARNKQ